MRGSKNLKNVSGVDPKGHGNFGGKGVPGCGPMYSGVDTKAAPFSNRRSPSMKSGGRKQRTRGG